ncbi:hypothetical protein [Erythrobacter litoralis]|uniref:Uncharacterized protein n=1 Tax=Erythrobacter litoralis (strain HTCC2594) TaxID=314225 RepID=Q2N9I2_ERYLH|nr:hypothetical protein [Erythrobacter litoralis]ABC63659.1 hypothetical protein ELI_07835 [Erythrobacter litoralis HTCC2594]
MRIWPLIAGIAGLAAAAVQMLRGQDGLPRMAGQLAHPAQGAMIEIVWHSLTGLMFVLAAGLLVSAGAGKPAGRIIGWLGAAGFGWITAVHFAKAHAALGDPFAFYPVWFSGVAAVLSAVAAMRR